LRLPEDEVHVWQARVDAESLRESQILDALAEDEIERAARFRFAKDRDQYVVGRSMMRALLGHYLGCLPQEIRLCYSPYGKPDLPDGLRSDLRFNLSHSRELVLLAVTRGSAIGVDVEFIEPKVINERVAEQFFSPYEVATLKALPAELQVLGFFNCWTRKEAFIKAKGEGLSMPLDQFDVSLQPGQPARLLAVRPNARGLDRWSLLDLRLRDGYVGAVAVEKAHCQWKHYDWPARNLAGI
jgi:4'-phosphopantetheinyl transferase